MNHPFSEEDIVRFIRGEMMESEQLSFQKELDTNQMLNDEVAEIKMALIAIDRAGEKSLKERFKKIEKKNKIKKWLIMVLGLVLIIISGLIAKKMMTPDKPIDNRILFATHFEKYRAPVIERDISQLKLFAASQSYKESNYEESAVLFGVLCNEENIQPCFYAALSSLYNGQEVHDYLRILLSQNESYAAIFHWNEALFLIRKGNFEKAEPILKKLIIDGTYKKEEAISVLNEIRKHKNNLR